MIRVEVEDYCQSCMDFSPDVTKPVRSLTETSNTVQTDTIIRCTHKKRCESIKRYLEQQMKVEAVG